MGSSTRIYGEFEPKEGAWKPVGIQGGYLGEFPNKSFRQWLWGEFLDQWGNPPEFRPWPDDVSQEALDHMEPTLGGHYVWCHDLASSVPKGHELRSWFEEEVMEPLERLGLGAATDGTEVKVRLILENV